jgi:hypothetical protein
MPHWVRSRILHRFHSSNYFCIQQQQIGLNNAGGLCLVRRMTTFLNEI